MTFPKEKRGRAEVAPWQPEVVNPPRQIRAGQDDISETDTLDFVAFRLDRALTLRPQLTQVCKRLHASFEDASWWKGRRRRSSEDCSKAW